MIKRIGARIAREAAAKETRAENIVNRMVYGRQYGNVRKRTSRGRAVRNEAAAESSVEAISPEDANGKQ